MRSAVASRLREAKGLGMVRPRLRSSSLLTMQLRSPRDPGADSSGEAEEPEPKKARFDESSDDVLLLRHRVSDKVHMLKGQSDRSILDQVLCCGRPLTDAYTRIDVPRTGQDRCAVCFRHWPMPQRDMS